MPGFEDTFKRLQQDQTYQPTKEDLARATYERQQAEQARDYDHPVNTRYREILGMMATSLTERAIPQEPHMLHVGVDREYSYHHMSHGKWNVISSSIEDARGWKIHLRKPDYERKNNSSYAPKDIEYLFLQENGQAGDTVENPIIVPIEHSKVSIKDISEFNRPIVEIDGRLYVHYSQLYRPYDAGLRGVLPLEHNRERYDDPYFELVNGELFCRYSITPDETTFQTYGRISLEETLARLLASKLIE